MEIEQTNQEMIDIQQEAMQEQQRKEMRIQELEVQNQVFQNKVTEVQKLERSMKTTNKEQ